LENPATSMTNIVFASITYIMVNYHFILKLPL
jgi:hypothetical protein